MELQLGLLEEVVAESQEFADAIASYARTTVLHGAYKGQMATGGNLASPLTPLESAARTHLKVSALCEALLLAPWYRLRKKETSYRF